MTSVFSEASTVQHGLIARLTSDLGWRYTRGEQLQRSLDSPFLEDELVSALLRLNPDIAESPDRLDEILPRLRLLTLEASNDGLVPANERMTTWLRGTQSVRYSGTAALSNVRLIDFDDVSANSFLVSDEVSYGSPGKRRRFDLVLWVNGLPLVVGETKSPVNSRVSWLTAARDLGDVYQRECATFFVPNLLSFATDGNELHYGAVGQSPEHWAMWGSTGDPADATGWPRVLRSVDLLLSPARILSLLRDFTLFERRAGGRVKLLPRYPQVEAAELILERVRNPEQARGLVWHYQGTGKTLLMAYTALALLNDESVGGATVLIVLDRIDLVEQTVRQFQTVGLPRLRVAASTADLRQMLEQDQRGVVVTTIFKFAESSTLNRRKNIVVLIDEAHRTQEGQLGSDLRRALPNAQFFGLTGTPIVSADRNTFRLFGDPTDPGWVLNEYSMSRAIADGTSVPIHLETRLPQYHIDSKALDEAFNAMADEERLDDEERELLASRAAGTRTLLANPARIEAVCQDIVSHYLSRVQPLGLKGQVVAYDRGLCVAYVDRLNELLDTAGSRAEAAVVMTVGTSKDEPAEWRERFSLDAAAEARIKARFNDSADPLSLLVVTAKLLTGFDAPIEGVLYLDKPLRRHTLFQAVCRANRRYTSPITRQEKQHGLIVDYVGLGDELVQALRRADPEGAATESIQVDSLLDELVAALASLLARFDGVDRRATTFESLYAAQELIQPGAEREAFAEEFLRLQSLWEFLWPQDSLLEHRADYKWLAMIYESVKPLNLTGDLLWHRLGVKTLAVVYGAIGTVGIDEALQEQVMVDPDMLTALARLREDAELAQPSAPVTVADALATIEARLAVRLAASGRHAVYMSLAERLEKLRQRSTAHAQAAIDFLRELLDVARVLLAAEKVEECEGDVSLLPEPNLGALTQILNEYAERREPEVIRSVVSDIDAIVKEVRFSGWTTSQPGDRTVKREIRRVLRRYMLPATGEIFEKTYAYVRENY